MAIGIYQRFPQAERSHFTQHRASCRSPLLFLNSPIRRVVFCQLLTVSTPKNTIKLVALFHLRTIPPPNKKQSLLIQQAWGVLFIKKINY